MPTHCQGNFLLDIPFALIEGHPTFIMRDRKTADSLGAPGSHLGRRAKMPVMNAPSLDPRKTPWKRGDVCTLGFDKNCFVLNHTPEYLEVRWMSDGSTEKIPTEAVDNLLRVAHADSLGPDGSRTNLEYLQVSETLGLLKHKLAERMKAIKSEKEKQELDRLTRRIFGEECKWDTRHAGELTSLLVAPETVGSGFKIREWVHRLFCPVK